MKTHTFLYQAAQENRYWEAARRYLGTGYKNAAERQQKITRKVYRLQLIRSCGWVHSNGSVQGVSKSVRDRVFVLPLAATVALCVVEVAVEGQVFRAAGLADAFSGDERCGRFRVAQQDEYRRGWFRSAFDLSMHVLKFCEAASKDATMPKHSGAIEWDDSSVA